MSFSESSGSGVAARVQILDNQCDRAGLAINAVVSVIRAGQETSIAKILENWILGQSINWNCSIKNTPEQNGVSARFGHLLTEKARCIRHHAKLLEDLTLNAI